MRATKARCSGAAGFRASGRRLKAEEKP